MLASQSWDTSWYQGARASQKAPARNIAILYQARSSLALMRPSPGHGLSPTTSREAIATWTRRGPGFGLTSLEIVESTNVVWKASDAGTRPLWRLLLRANSWRR